MPPFACNLFSSLSLRKPRPNGLKSFSAIRSPPFCQPLNPSNGSAHSAPFRFLRIKKPGRLPAPGHHTYSPYQYKSFTNLILAVICGLSKFQKYF
jgi:hypothetical protein